MCRSRSLYRARRAGLLVAAMLVGRLLGAQSSAAPARLDTAAILKSARPEIDAANAAWLPGLRNHDAASIAAPYADSGLFIATDGTVVRGRAAVAAMYVARFPRLGKIRNGGIIQGGVAVVAPTLVYEWGQGWLELEPAGGGAPTRSGGTYLTVWQRATDGHWRIARNLTF